MRFVCFTTVEGLCSKSITAQAYNVCRAGCDLSHVALRPYGFTNCVSRRTGKRGMSVMEGGQEVLKRESMGRRFKGELRDLVERINSTEVSFRTEAGLKTFVR